MAIELQFDLTTSGNYDTLAVPGEVDAFTSPVLRERLVSLLDGGHYHLVVDPEGVDFMDSTRLGVLVSA